MGEHDEARRAFLIGAAVGAVAGTGLVSETRAQDAKTAAASPQQRKEPGSASGGMFFNDEDAATIAAFAERIMPGAPGMAGANDAGVLDYIDIALAGPYVDQQSFYRSGLAALDAYCRQTYQTPFARLDPARQDDVIRALEAGKATGFGWPAAAAFFNTVRTHTMEGMFADPIYGGNKDFAGWQLVGFPGAQPLFVEAELRSSDAYTRKPIGLRMQAPVRKG
jgi:gluconate 2-dehydrogenase gamma chain